MLEEQVYALDHQFYVKIEKANAQEGPVESAPASPDIAVYSEKWKHGSVRFVEKTLNLISVCRQRT